MQGWNIAEMGHVVNILPPVDVNGGKNSDVFDMKNYGHATIIVQIGVSAAAPTVKVQECDDFVPSTPTDIAFDVYKEETAAGDTLGARVANASTGVVASGNDNIFYVIEVDARKLSDGKGKLRLNFSDPSGSCIASAVAVLSGARFGNTLSPTAIA